MGIIYHENKPPTYICQDCGLNYTHFDNHMIILKDEIWLSIANEKDIICDCCIEERLNRNITNDDLWKNEQGKISEINYWKIKEQKFNPNDYCVNCKKQPCQCHLRAMDF